MTKLRSQIKSGLLWSFINQGLGQVLFVVFNIYLSRLLGPFVFGTIGMVTIFSGFASLFIDAGFGAAIIQKLNISQKELSTIFWSNMLVGVILYFIFFFSAEFIASFYKEKSLVLLTRVMTLSFVISAVSIVHSSILLKQLDFKRKTMINWLSILVSYAIAFALAFLGYGIWAMAAYTLINPLLSSILMWNLSKWRPSLHFSTKEFKDLSRFGLNVLGDTTINYWSRNADNFLIGKYLGSFELGIYSRAYAIMMLPMRNISSVISNVMFPAFSTVQNDINVIKHYYIKTIKLVGLICFPLMIGLAALSYEFTSIFFGKEWLQMAEILRWLCILAAFQSILSLNGIIYKSLGRADIAFKVSIMVSCVIIPAYAVGIYLDGLKGLVLAYFVSSTLLMVPIYHTALKLINTSLFEIILCQKGILISVAVMAAVLILIKFIAPFNHTILGFLLQIFIGVSVYITGIFFFEKDLIKKLLFKIFKYEPFKQLFSYF